MNYRQTCGERFMNARERCSRGLMRLARRGETVALKLLLGEGHGFRANQLLRSRAFASFTGISRVNRHGFGVRAGPSDRGRCHAVGQWLRGLLCTVGTKLAN